MFPESTANPHKHWVCRVWPLFENVTLVTLIFVTLRVTLHPPALDFTGFFTLVTLVTLIFVKVTRVRK